MKLNPEHKKKISIVLGLTLFALVAVATYYTGAYAACNSGGGFLNKDLTCVDLEVIGVCEWQGQYYIQPNWQPNISVMMNG